MADDESTAPVVENSPLIVDRWYWVTSDRENWFPAKHDPRYSGGWHNEDTFDDYAGEVVAWRLMPLQEDIETVCRFARKYSKSENSDVGKAITRLLYEK